MRIAVQLHATLTTFLPSTGRDGSATLDLDEGTAVADLVRRLGIPPELSRIVLVNGHDVEDGAALRDGDVVDIFPPLAGGAAAGWYTRTAPEASRNPVGLPDFKSGVRL